MDRVIARAAVEEVVARDIVQRVVARAAVERVIVRPTIELVVAPIAGQGIVADTAVEAICASAVVALCASVGRCFDHVENIARFGIKQDPVCLCRRRDCDRAACRNSARADKVAHVINLGQLERVGGLVGKGH